MIKADTFVLFRILGNDLYPRHKKGQTRENLQFALENEPHFEKCEKRWVVNRIIDKATEHAIIELLFRHNQQFIHLPFREKDYRQIGLDTECLPEPGYLAGEKFENLTPKQRDKLMAATYRLKNNYVMNNNGARNTALRDGKHRAKWVLPWDGNCYLTLAAWKQIFSDVTASPDFKYFFVPMTRVVDNNQLLKDDFMPNPVEEPQLIFRTDSAEEFNEAFCYGHRSKVELFWRLGIPGKWDQWEDEPWDQARRPKSSEAHQFGTAGWVARMYSGMKSLEQDSQDGFEQRGLARLQAIINTLRDLDTKVSGKSPESNELSVLRTEILREERNRFRSGECVPLIEQLVSDAEEALRRGPFTVTDKKTLPPSGNANDYWHPAPYWWPNPDTQDGLPYIQRDGERVHGTKLFEPESDKYDRTRLQRVFDDSMILALAWYFTGEKQYAGHGAHILERFFTDPATRMNPHLNYAQVIMGRNNNMGTNYGIIEMKDLYYYLDAARILKSAQVFPENTWDAFKKWLSDYLDWLVQSAQGKSECKAANNHGTYYDLQIAAIADFIYDRQILYDTLVRAQSRIRQQFKPDGAQPEEIKRATSAHYCCFNLQGWINLAELASRWGIDLWSYKAPEGTSIYKGVEWLFAHISQPWPYKQVDKFDPERYFPIWFAMPEAPIKLPKAVSFPESKYRVKPKFFPHDGIRPYWNLGLHAQL